MEPIEPNNLSSLAIIFSSVSIGLALVTFVWTVIEKFIRPQSYVTAMVGSIHHRGETHGPYITMSLVNKGPGKIVVRNIFFRQKRTWEMRLKKELYQGTINYDWENRYNPEMPGDVPQYDTYTQNLKFDEDCGFKLDIRGIGYIDTLNRYHWVRRKDVRRIAKEYREKFSSPENQATDNQKDGDGQARPER